MRVKIPPLDVALVATAALVAVLGALRSALAARGALSSAEPTGALFALALCAPQWLAARVLWAAAVVRATSWRRVAARGSAVVLGALSCSAALVGLGALMPAPLALTGPWPHALALGLLALALGVYATSPARRLPRAPRR